MVKFEDNVVQKIERTRIAPDQDSFLFNNLMTNAEYEIGVIAYVDHEPRKVYRISLTTAAQPALLLDTEPVVVKDGDLYTVHWKKPEEVMSTKFIVEYKPANETRWRRVHEDRDASEDEESYSVSAPELNNAFSVRVVVVDDEQRAVARTKEALISGGVGACEGVSGAPSEIRVQQSGNTITFTWNTPSCDQETSNILGYEYMFWNHDDGMPSEFTDYTTKNHVVINDVQPSGVYSFRVRSRLTHGHSSWSQTFETNNLHSGRQGLFLFS